MSRRLIGTLTDPTGTALTGWLLELIARANSAPTMPMGATEIVTLTSLGGYDVVLQDGFYLATLTAPGSTTPRRLGNFIVAAGTDIDLLTLIALYSPPGSPGTVALSLAVADEGTQIAAAAASMNFTGAGVSVSASGAAVTINVPGGGGSSSGDVVGPSSSVAGNLPSFSNTTGKLLGDSGVSPATFATAANLAAHTGNVSNPHTVTKAQVGLGSADNTSDASKPVSTATQTALDAKVAANTAITGATKTKITYDAKGLVNSGANATQDDIGDGTTNKQYPATDKTKVGFITVTQSVNLDTINTRVVDLDAAVILRGGWDASTGVFPGGGTAQAGASYIVSVAGTVGGVAFDVNDRIIAILDNASTTVFAANWFKADYTDQVLSVFGRTGAVALQAADVNTALGYTAGNVTGPASAVDNRVAFLSGTTGKIIKDSGFTLTAANYRYLGEFAYASLPAASGNQYCYALATDIGIAPGTVMQSDNTRWVPVMPRYGFDGGSWFAPQYTNFNAHLGTWVPPGNSSSGLPGVTGMVSPTVVGTAAGRAVATTNAMTLTNRLGRDSAATAGSLVSHYAVATKFKLGDDSGLGGFLFTVIFGCSDAATVSGARQCIGVSNTTSAPTNVEPSTLTNHIGVGHGASDTNLKIYFAGSATQTPIDLGANFPANTLSADAYFFALYSPINPTAAGYKVGWYIKRLGTTYSANGTLNGTSGTVLPDTTTLLAAPRFWRCNNATALAVSLDLGTSTLAIPSL